MAPVYPLKQIIEVKKKRVEDAEKVVQQKKAILAQEEEKLKEREKSRDKVLKHMEAKLRQLRSELDQGSFAPKIQQMKNYLKLVKENLTAEEKKVKEQKEQVATAKKNVEDALLDLKRKRIEVDKLELHRKDWTRQMKKEEEIREEAGFNELGAITFSLKKKQQKMLRSL